VTVRLVLAEDNFLVREGIRRLLDGEEDLEVVETCQDLPGLLDAVDRVQPDVVLTDIRMPPGRADEGVQASEYCRRTHPGMGVILLSQYAEPAYVRVLLSQGAQGRGYLLKERVADVEDMTDAIRQVAEGGSAIDPKVVETLVRVRSGGDGDLSHLTAREREVLGAMAQGKNNAAIAGLLVISQRAVEKHINSIFAKVGITGDTQGHPRVRAVLMYLAGLGD
jgi:DNA-binding NarL/FixJ family response regulator